MLNNYQLSYLNALRKINGVGAQKMRKLMAFFSSPEEIWKANISALSQSGIGESLASKIFTQKQKIDPKKEWEKLEKENIRLIDETDKNYPQLLKEISSAPYLLYIKGTMNLNDPMISIVGSRKHTEYGFQAAYSLSKDLARAGITIVSGMAYGIDSIAHRGALDGGGSTIAVLGNSLDDKHIYPSGNFQLSREIINNGCLLSDYPLETPAGIPGNFPARNRLIAGLSTGTLVIEAGEKSGTLITSGFALEFNRDVFAVPGSIFSSQSSGTNHLIRQGAKLVVGVQDILEEISFATSTETNSRTIKVPENKNEEIVLHLLSSEPLHIDNLAKRSKLGTATVSSTLSLMEIKGWVKNIGGQNYIII